MKQWHKLFHSSSYLWSLRKRLPRSWSRALLAIALFTGVVRLWFLPLIGSWFMVPAFPTERADAIVVLGGARTRSRSGIALFQRGIATELWHTGWKEPPFPSETSNHDHLTDLAGQPHQVPSEAIHLLTTRSTWEDGREIAALARKRHVQSIVVVTDWFHSRRALCVIRHHLRGSGVTVYYKPNPIVPMPDTFETVWQDNHLRALVFSELKKLIYYGVHYGLPLWRC